MLLAVVKRKKRMVWAAIAPHALLTTYLNSLILMNDRYICCIPSCNEARCNEACCKSSFDEAENEASEVSFFSSWTIRGWVVVTYDAIEMNCWRSGDIFLILKFYNLPITERSSLGRGCIWALTTWMCSAEKGKNKLLELSVYLSFLQECFDSESQGKLCYHDVNFIWSRAD